MKSLQFSSIPPQPNLCAYSADKLSRSTVSVKTCLIVIIDDDFVMIVEYRNNIQYSLVGFQYLMQVSAADLCTVYLYLHFIFISILMLSTIFQPKDFYIIEYCDMMICDEVAL